MPTKKVKKKYVFGMFIDIWCEKKLQIEAKFTHVNEHFYAKNIHYVYESRCQKIQKSF